MPDEAPDRALRQVGIAAAAMAAQREMLRDSLRRANLAGHSLRQLSAMSGISHEAVRRMINTQTADSRRLINEHIKTAVKNAGLDRMGRDRQMRAMMAEVSRQSRQINEQMAKQ